MPAAWSKKDERQYKHIMQSSEDEGVPTKRAKEIAARTVNKNRRKEGRTPNKTTQGTGNPRTHLKERTKAELYNLAKDKNVAGRNTMNKQQLLSALSKK